MKEEIRLIVYDKYSGHCAYCGKELQYELMDVDHLIAKHIGGSDNIFNFMPSCKTCNYHKSTFSLEHFRAEIKLKVGRERKRSNFRLLENIGIIQENDIPVVFYFEKWEQEKCK